MKPPYHFLSFKKATKYLFCICVVFLLHLELSAQNNEKRDSLLIELEKKDTNESSSVADLLNKLGDEYLDVDLDTALHYFERALKLSTKIDYLQGEARANYRKSVIHYYNGDYEEGLTALFTALSIYQTIGDNIGSTRSLKNIAAFYQTTKDLPKAVLYGKEALEFSKKTDDRLLVGRIVNNLGNIYSDFKEPNKKDTARMMYNQALIIYKEFDYDIGVSRVLNNLGNFHQRMNDQDSAMWYLEQSLAIDRRINTDPYGMCITLHNIANHYISKGEYQKATSYLNESLQISLENTFKEQTSAAYYYFESIYRKRGDYQKAYEMLQKQATIDRQLTQLKQNEIIEELNAKYENEKKEQEIANLESQAAIQELEISRKNQNQLILGILILLLILAVILVYVIYRQKRINLANRADEVEQRLLRAQMNPHFIFNSLSSIQEFVLSGDEKSASRYLTKFSRLIREVLDHTRSEYISLEKEVSLLDSYLSLQNLKRSIPFDFEIIVDENIDAEELLIPPMFAQPFIENAIEHGLKRETEEAKITVQFTLKKDYLVLEISDNGVGILASARTKNSSHRSLATKITEERIELFKRTIKKDISFDLKSSGKGTSVTFNLPYQFG